MTITTSPFARPVAGVDPTERQIDYIASLLEDRDWATDDVHQENTVARAAQIAVAINVARNGHEAATAPFIGGRVNQLLHLGGLKQLTKTGASAMIEWLAGKPRKTATTPAPQVAVADEVPAGRYAVATEDGAVNGLAFYKVDRPTEGKWAGRVFVKLMRSDEEVRLSWTATQAVLAKIAEAGAEEASKAYGREIGECGVCGRTLTNDDSRAAGIGPKCAEKF
ncbi:hypothetical protein SEA_LITTLEMUNCHKIN_42 [Gordonia phage LittleMunchkin]|nr:hypothetical protein SEA_LITTLEMUNCHKIN_42 [Gordonia phage LittleMunchkin]